jgi:hypothetical protein
MTTVRKLTPCATLRATLQRMANHGEEPTQVALKRGLIIQLRPGVSFTLARKGDVRPSKEEARIVCEAARGAGVRIYVIDAVPDESGPFKVLRWNLTPAEQAAPQLL